MAEVSQLTKAQIIGELSKSPHGKLGEYVPLFDRAFKVEPEFSAHLIAWNHEKGSIKDSKVALPVISLKHLVDQKELHENSLAHLALLDPREFVRGLDFHRTIKPTSNSRTLRRLVERYVRHRESSFGLWERAFLSHRASMKRLYGLYHIKPGSKLIDDCLKGEYPKGSTLEVYSRMHQMEPREALGHVLNRGIPFKQAVGALGKKLADPDTVLALMAGMSAVELTTNAKMLERLGVKTNPALRSAFAAGLQKAMASAPKQALLKTAKAAKAVGGEMGKQLADVQEKQIKATGGVKGRWLVLGDKSGSMEKSIELSRFVAGHLARFAEECHLIFFDSDVYYKVVTGWTLERIQSETKYIRAEGGTHILIGLEYLRQKGIEVDGIAIVSDGGDNHPDYIPRFWKKYCDQFGKEPTLYFYKVQGSDPDRLTTALNTAGVGFETYDLRGGVDYYSLPNLVMTMNTRRWSLADQIMETPLKTLDEVFTAH